jgi:hypothetical protein
MTDDEAREMLRSMVDRGLIELVGEPTGDILTQAFQVTEKGSAIAADLPIDPRTGEVDLSDDEEYERRVRDWKEEER